jgi:eukaryotic-like serine/threonine-protein kinase
MDTHRTNALRRECGALPSPLPELVVAAIRNGQPDVDQPPTDPSAQQLRFADHAAVDRLGSDPGPEIVARLVGNPSATEGGSAAGCREHSSLDAGVAEQQCADLCETRLATFDEEVSTCRLSVPTDGFYESHTTLVGREDEEPDETPLASLCREYRSIIGRQRLDGLQDYPLRQLLGAGGQGKVYLSERLGADDYRQPLAVKVFSPEKYPSARSYQTAMARLSQLASQLSWPQHGNVVGIQGFEQRGQIRIMLMELVEGYDLCQLLDPKLPEELRASLSAEHWDEVCRVVMVPAPEGSRLQPGVAVSIIRDCLSGLDSLHRRGLMHGDIKLANIMVQRSGRAKIIDLGSANHPKSPPHALVITPAYAAPEVLQGHRQTRRSDLASLGYVLIELLAGQRLFAGLGRIEDLIEAKRDLPRRLKDLLPSNVRESEMLIEFCRRLIAPNPDERWPSAERADIDQTCGASKFFDQLVLGNMASIYDSEIRVWLRPLPSRNL